MLVISSNNIENFGIGQKVIDKIKIGNFLDLMSSRKMIKIASSEKEVNALSILVQALSDMGIKTEINISDLLKRMASKAEESEQMEKTAAKKSFNKEETIKIASKQIKDSHYQVDVSKDLIEKNGIKLYMVSAYARDSYLGKYLIKRNYYYLEDNEKSANDCFEELSSKVKKIRDAYYKGNIEIKAITSDIVRVFQGVISDMKFESEDDIGTTVKRD